MSPAQNTQHLNAKNINTERALSAHKKTWHVRDHTPKEEAGGQVVEQIVQSRGEHGTGLSVYGFSGPNRPKQRYEEEAPGSRND